MDNAENNLKRKVEHLSQNVDEEKKPKVDRCINDSSACNEDDKSICFDSKELNKKSSSAVSIKSSNSTEMNEGCNVQLEFNDGNAGIKPDSDSDEVIPSNSMDCTENSSKDITNTTYNEKDENAAKKINKIEKTNVPKFDSDGNPILFNGVEVSKLTKTQFKKYVRVLKWQHSKQEKRAKERIKTKIRIKEAKENNIDIGPSRKLLKRKTMESSSCKMCVVIDMSFDDLMISKDLGKLIKQTLRVYTINRRSKEALQLYITNFEGKAKEEMAKHNGYENWDINFHACSYLDVFPKERLVYLTSESDNIITNFEDDKVYIIGGLVDHNSHKGICYKKAVEEGISHAQLPISQYFQFKHRKVFTINQVFEIIVGVTEGKSFKEAFELALPKRINMQPTTKNLDGETSNDDSEEQVMNATELQKVNID